MYVTPKCMPSKATFENTKLGRLSDEVPTPSCSSIRCWLLFWASLRLAVSILWTGVLTMMSYKTIDYFWYQRHATYILEAPYVLTLSVVAVFSQLVEFGMLVTFIVAGIKKSARLYLVYYRYCILTLIIYITAVILCATTDYEDGHFFGEMYITYHVDDLPIAPYEGVSFVVIAIFDVCLEVLLIILIKKLVNRYSHVENNVTCDKV